MRKIIVNFLIIASAGLAYFSLAPQTMAQDQINALDAETFPTGLFEDLRATRQGMVTRIISPYALQLDDGSLVRLTGLFYPDYSEAGAGDLSLLAMQVLEDFLVGQSVSLYQTKNAQSGRVNRMGQDLAHVARDADGAWAQGVILSLGLAVVQTISSNPEMAEQMLTIENNARDQNLGVWESTMHVLTPEEAAGAIGSFQIVEGRIESAALKNNRVYLNFGKNWRDDFTVTIAPEHKRSFSKLGMNILDLNGQSVRVRGWLTSYNGPNMEIDHPAALEIMNKGKDAPRPAPSTLEGSALPSALPVINAP